MKVYESGSRHWTELVADGTGVAKAAALGGAMGCALLPVGDTLTEGMGKLVQAAATSPIVNARSRDANYRPPSESADTPSPDGPRHPSGISTIVPVWILGQQRHTPCPSSRRAPEQGRSGDRHNVVSKFGFLPVLLFLVACEAALTPTATPAQSFEFPLPTEERVAIPPGAVRACFGIGLDAILHGDPSDPRVAWIADRLSGQRKDVTWPAGYRARFAPDLQVFDPGGQVVLRENSPISGACVTAHPGVLHLAPPF